MIRQPLKALPWFSGGRCSKIRLCFLFMALRRTSGPVKQALSLADSRLNP